MTRIVAAAFLLLGLASCADDTRSAPGTPQRACEDAADDSPAVKQALLNTANPNAGTAGTRALREARGNAITACLRIRGVLPPGGGVERPIY
jgi:hypothetical protein